MIANNLSRTNNGLSHPSGMAIQTPLKLVRLRRGLRSREVSRALNLDSGQYSRIERGAGLSPALARRIALFFGREVTELQILYPEDYITVEEMNPD